MIIFRVNPKGTRSHFVNKLSDHDDTGGQGMVFLSAVHIWPGQAPRVYLSEPPAHIWTPGFELETLKPPVLLMQ